MRNKWRYIRDHALVHKKRLKRGEVTEKRKKNAYADRLYFLWDKRKKKTSGNNEDEKNVETQPQSWREKDVTPYQNALVQNPNTTNTNLEFEDPDKLYILSLLADYKKLNEVEKMDFKYITLKFFRRRRRNYSRGSLCREDFELPPESPSPTFPQLTSQSLHLTESKHCFHEDPLSLSSSRL